MSFRIPRRVLTAALIAASALALASCITLLSGSPQRGGRTPAWVENKDSVYPPDQYLAEVGEGDNLNSAKANAAAAIAQIFRTRVTVDSTIRTRYTELTAEGGATLGMAAQTDFDQSIGQSADQSLSNLRYGESWTDSMGRVYAVAYLDRSETGNLYRRRIMAEDARVSELMDRARVQDEPLRRYAFLDAALVVAEANRVLKEQLEIINNPLAGSVLPSYDLGSLKAAAADQASALKVSVEVAGDDGRITAVLSDWATDKGFSVSAVGDMLLSGILAISAVKLDNGYDNLSWELNLILMDSFGYPAVSLPAQNRSSGISASAAENRAYRDMTELIQKDFNRAFLAYLASFLEK